jgi:hypothetical protein
MNPKDIPNLDTIIAAGRRQGGPTFPSDAGLLAEALEAFGRQQPTDPSADPGFDHLNWALLNYRPSSVAAGTQFTDGESSDLSSTTGAIAEDDTPPDDGGSIGATGSPESAWLIPVSNTLRSLPSYGPDTSSPSVPDTSGTVIGAPSQNSGTGPSTDGDIAGPGALSAPAPGRQINPYRTDVFQPGADGKLHPIPGWHTTGPRDFGAWSHNIDWNGVGDDLNSIASNALLALEDPGALAALGLEGPFGRGPKGVIHGHHTHPMFMGGRPDQEVYDLIASFHRQFHGELTPALRNEGFPPVGGTTGGKVDWADVFNKSPEDEWKAIGILWKVSRDFDIEHGTSILPALEKELKLRTSKPSPPRPPPPSIRPVLTQPDHKNKTRTY